MMCKSVDISCKGKWFLLYTKIYCTFNVFHEYQTMIGFEYKSQYSKQQNTMRYMHKNLAPDKYSLLVKWD